MNKLFLTALSMILFCSATPIVANDIRIAHRICGLTVEVAPERFVVMMDSGDVTCVNAEDETIWRYSGISGRLGRDCMQLIPLKDQRSCIAIGACIARLDSEGREIWRAEKAQPGSGRGVLTPDARLLLTVDRGHQIHANQVVDGKLAWVATEHSVDPELGLSVSAEDVAGVDVFGVIECYSLDGKYRWAANAGDRVVALSAPNAKGERICGMLNGSIAAVDREGHVEVIANVSSAEVVDVTRVDDDQFLVLSRDVLEMRHREKGVVWGLRHAVRSPERIQVVTPHLYALLATGKDALLIRVEGKKRSWTRLSPDHEPTSVILCPSLQTLFYGTSTGWFCSRPIPPLEEEQSPGTAP